MIELYQTAQQTAQKLSPSLAPALSVSNSESRLGWRYLRRQTLSALPLLAADIFSLSLVAAIAFGLSLTPWFQYSLAPLSLSLYLCVAGILSFAILGLYPNLGYHPAVELKKTIVPLTILIACLAATINGSTSTLPFVSGLFAIWVVLILLVPLTRAFARRFAARWLPFTLQPIVILGGGPVGEAIYRSIDSNPGCGFRPLGIVDDAHEQWTHQDNVPEWYIGTYPELQRIVESHDTYWAIVTDSQAIDNQFNQPEENRISPVELPHRLYLAETASFVPTMWDQVLTINLVPYFKQTDRLLLPIPRLIKRLSDYTICAILAVIILPVAIFLSVAIKLTSSGPIFFRSKRIGRGNRVFRMFKFRSMYTNSELLLEQQLNDCPDTRDEWKTNQKLRHDPRITSIGKLMRRTSLDELPQLVDVLRGKMSLVGPRPMLVSEPDMYGMHYSLYCRMRPGITGLWQVSGRNNTSHEKRVRLVAYYVQNWSPWLDIYILAKTFKVVTTGEGAY